MKGKLIFTFFQSETTGCLVHKLEKSTESEQYNALVSEFSLQIMHEPFHISANGFFTIDFELLGSVSPTYLTYFGTKLCKMYLNFFLVLRWLLLRLLTL